jgi:hypothetical protein
MRGLEFLGLARIVGEDAMAFTMKGIEIERLDELAGTFRRLIDDLDYDRYQHAALPSA